MSNNGYEMCSGILDLIFSTVDSGKTILEFGSGDGTKKLVEHGYKVYSIEENVNFCYLHHNNYFYCPLVGESYDVRTYNVQEVLDFVSDIKYDAILVDGPANGARHNLVELFSHLNTDVVIFVDDIERQSDRQFFNAIIDDREFEDFERYGVIK